MISGVGSKGLTICQTEKYETCFKPLETWRKIMTAPLGTKHRHNPKQRWKTQFRYPLGSEAHRRGYPGLSRPLVVSPFHFTQIPRSLVAMGMLGISMLLLMLIAWQTERLHRAQHQC